VNIAKVMGGMRKLSENLVVSLVSAVDFSLNFIGKPPTTPRGSFFLLISRLCYIIEREALCK